MEAQEPAELFSGLLAQLGDLLRHFMAELDDSRLDRTQTFINLFVGPFQVGNADFQSVRHEIMVAEKSSACGRIFRLKGYIGWPARS